MRTLPHSVSWARLARAIDRFGDFELLKRLGAGAQAEVFLAATRDEQLVALKVMLEHLTVRPESRDAFKREARTSSLLKHPNLVEVYEVGEEDGRPWISMELVRGWSLSTLLKKLRASGARLDQDEAAEVIRQAALGLHFAHEVKGRDGEPLGLVHRDVSPQNIMVSELGIAKVVDFGLAKATAQSETITATIKGKLRYMPPEQLKSQKLDRRCDVFALGAVLWELACGSQLYPGQSEAEVFQQALYSPQPHPDEVAKGLSRGMVSVLLATTQREVDKRMGSAKELAEALAPLSSPHARDKLGERVAKLFEKLPRTLEEARGIEHSGPTQSTKTKKAGVLAPPPKQASYVEKKGPVPEGSDFRERRTDQVEAVYPAERPTVRPTRPERATIPQEKPAPPVPEEPATDAGGLSAVSEVSAEVSSETQNSGVTNPSVGPLLESDTVANTSPGVSALTSVDDEATHGSMISAPSRRVIVITVAASVGIVLLGGIVGALLRDGEEESDPYADRTPRPTADSRPRQPPEPTPPPHDTDNVEAVVPAPPDAGLAAARVADGKRRSSSRQGRVEIDSNIPAVVRERNVDLGVTPFSRQLAPGRHRISVATPDGSASTEMDLVVRPGETVRRTVKLNPR